MYKGVQTIFGVYWRAYGGLRALAESFYLHLALILLALTYHTWTEPQWWELVISALPNLLGFTLGGFAIFLGFGDDGFKESLASLRDNEAVEESPFIKLCATFVHFIIVQVVALVLALLAKSWWFTADWMSPYSEYLYFMNAVGGAIGFGFFLYAITSILAATTHVLRIGSMYAKYQRLKRQRREDAAKNGCDSRHP